MKKFILSLAAMALAGNVMADNAELNPTLSTMLHAGEADEDHAGVSPFVTNMTGVADGLFTDKLSAYGGSYVCIYKFDASGYKKDVTVTKATIAFDATCTVAGKNSEMFVASINTDWDEDATWNNTNSTIGAVQLGSAGWTEKGPTVSPRSYDVTEVVNNDADGIVGFAIYTSTGREHKIENVKLTLEYSSGVVSKVDYRVVDSFGNVLKSGNEYPGTAVSVAYPKYILSEGTLYEAAAQESGAKYVLKGEVAAEGGDITIDYAAAVENVVYYSELENIEGVSRTFDNDAASGKIGDFQGKTDNIALTDLAAGEYKITFHFISANATNPDIAFVAGPNTLYKTATKNGDNLFVSDAITLAEANTLSIVPFEGGSKKGIDYIIVEKVEAPTAKKALNMTLRNSNVIYNLRGQKVNNSFKGIVIKGGKKYIQK